MTIIMHNWSYGRGHITNASLSASLSLSMCCGQLLPEQKCFQYSLELEQLSLSILCCYLLRADWPMKARGTVILSQRRSRISRPESGWDIARATSTMSVWTVNTGGASTTTPPPGNKNSRHWCDKRNLRKTTSNHFPLAVVDRDLHLYSVHHLRSASSLQLDILGTHRTTGDRAFTAAGPTLRNSLPHDIADCASLTSFCRKLKLFCFLHHFHDYVFLFIGSWGFDLGYFKNLWHM